MANDAFSCLLADRFRDLFRSPGVARPADELAIEARTALLDMCHPGSVLIHERAPHCCLRAFSMAAKRVSMFSMS